jgi:thioredoxin reductase
MSNRNIFDVIIIGGSYSGLAAGMALGRALRKVLIIDNGKPCNIQTPHSHNFLTNDGKAPAEIAAIAIRQVKKYDTVKFFNGTALAAGRSGGRFEITVDNGELFQAKKLVFASGIKDRLPDIEGIEACWGISVIHCPYCHGYEVRNKKTGILANGDFGFEFTRMISNWTKDLTLYTNGTSLLSDLQREKLEEHQIKIVEKEIVKFEHKKGIIHSIIFKDGTKTSVDAVYAPAPFEQHSRIPESMGCELTEEGYIKVNDIQETTIEGVFAIGDMATKMRTVANAVSTGTAAGMMINKKIILEEF